MQKDDDAAPGAKASDTTPKGATAGDKMAGDKTLRRTPPVIEGRATEVAPAHSATADAATADAVPPAAPSPTAADIPASEDAAAPEKSAEDAPAAPDSGLVDETVAATPPRRSLAVPLAFGAGLLIVGGGLAYQFADSFGGPTIPPTAATAPNASAPKASPSKPDSSKPDASKADAFKPDTPKADAARREIAKSEPVKPAPANPEAVKDTRAVAAPSSNAPQSVGGPQNAAKPDAPKAEPPKTDSPKTESPKTAEAAKPAPAEPPKPAIASPQPAQTAAAQKTAEPGAAPAALERIGALAAKLDQLAARLDAAQAANDRTAGAATAAVRAAEGLTGKIDALGQRLGALEQRLDQPKTDMRAPEARDAGAGHAAESLGARAVAAQTAAQDLASGRAVGPAVAALSALGVEPQRLGAFEPFLKTAPPTLGQLADQWRALRGKATTEPATHANWYDSLIAKAAHLVKIRPVGDATGASAAAVYARVEAALSRGDLAGATDAAGALPAPAKAAVAEWTQSATRLRAALEAARALAAESISALGRPKT